MELLVKINKKLEQRRAILNTIIQNVGIQNKILKSAQILAECLKLGGKIITAGNGGSASQSEHFSSEMMGRLKNSRTPFPSLSLSSNASLLTCIGNDFGFERIFSLLQNSSNFDSKPMLALIVDENCLSKGFNFAKDLRQNYIVSVLKAPNKVGKYLNKLKEAGFSFFVNLCQDDEIKPLN